MSQLSKDMKSIFLGKIARVMSIKSLVTFITKIKGCKILPPFILSIRVRKFRSGEIIWGLIFLLCHCPSHFLSIYFILNWTTDYLESLKRLV